MSTSPISIIIEVRSGRDNDPLLCELALRNRLEFHKVSYAICYCSGSLEMRHMSQLEMRQSSPLGMLVKRQRLEGRLAT